MAELAVASVRDRYITLVVLLLGLLYSYDSTVMAGAQLFVTSRLGLSVPEQGTLHASLAIGMILGATGAARMADVLGRKRAMVLTTAVYSLVAVVSPLAANLLWLDATRLLMGAGLGILLVVTPIFIAESASTAVRGRIGVHYQVATVTGIVLAYLSAFGLARTGNWRAMLWGSALCAILAVIVLVPAPETLQWQRLRQHAALVGPAGTSAARGGLRELFSRRYRAVTLFVIVFGVFAQITGISAVGLFGPRIFQRMGYEGYFTVLLVPALIQIAGLVAALGAAFSVDRFGRRMTLLSGISVMAAGHALLTVALAAGQGSQTSAIGVVGMLVFVVGFNSGFGAVVWVTPPRGTPTGYGQLELGCCCCPTSWRTSY